jgi:hypothetical protein
MKKLDGFQIKVIALMVMLLDHLYFAFPKIFPLWFHPLSRFVAPVFAFLMVEGLFHTRNKFKYNIRLFGFAIFMGIGNFIINNAFASKEVAVHNNIFLTLAIGLLMINLLELSKKKKGTSKIVLIIGGILLIPIGILLAEGGFSLIPFILITYLFREKIKIKVILYIVLSALLFAMNYVQYDTLNSTITMLMLNCDFLFITVVPFMFLYNGERGLNNKFSKYLFYVFYPVHLWVLAIIEFLIK